MAYKNPDDHKAAMRRHYEANKESYADRRKKYRSEMRDIIVAAKNVPCADCGETYPHYVMDFDHLPGFEKSFNIGSYSRATKGTLEQEIAKCEVVCSNCHRIRTHTRRS